MKSGLHEKMYHSESKTLSFVQKSKIRITDSYEFIRHMHECQFNFVYLYNRYAKSEYSRSTSETPFKETKSATMNIFRFFLFSF